MRDRYIDLYEFAPVGYLTISGDGLIIEANLTGAEMLGAERNKLINRRFSSFICEEESDRWHHHLLAVLKRDGRQQCELALKRGDGSLLHVNVTSVKLGDS